MNRLLRFFRALNKLPLTPIEWGCANPEHFGDIAGGRVARQWARSRIAGSELVKLVASMHRAVCPISEVRRYVCCNCNILVGLRSKTSLKVLKLTRQRSLRRILSTA